MVVVETDEGPVQVWQFFGGKFFALLDRHGAYEAAQIGIRTLYLGTVLDVLDKSDEDPPGKSVTVAEVARKSPDFILLVYHAALKINEFKAYVARLQELKKKDEIPEGESSQPPTS